MSTCNPSYPTSGSLDQGANFARLTASYHGGRRSHRNMRSRSRMARNRRSTARRSTARRSTARRMRGGGLFTPYAEYPTSMDQMLPNELVADARLADLNAKFAELPSVEAAAGVSPSPVPSVGTYVSPPSASGPMAGGGRRRSSISRRRRHMRGGQAAINAPSMLISSQAEEEAARLNPQWYTENTVIPGFRGPLPVPGGSRRVQSRRVQSRRKQSRRKQSRHRR